MNDDTPDEVLLQGCRDGRADAWSVLVRRYQRLVYTVPRRAGLDDGACADVFQLTFTRLLEHLPRIEDASRVRAWLVTTARRESLLRLERLQRERPVGGEPGSGDEDPLAAVPDPDPLPEERLSRWQELDRLRRAVDRLEPRTRQFVELLFLQDEPLPYAEIAARLGIPEGSIGPTRSRALQKLRRLLEDDG